MKKALLALLVATVLATGASAQEEEAEYKRWKLDFGYDTPDNVVLKTATRDLRVVWYMTYRVTNNTDGDVPLNLAIKGVTDRDVTHLDSIDPLAKKQIEKKVGKKLKDALDMSRGTIPAGESLNAVAILGDIDPGWDRLAVRVTGLVETIDKVDGKLYFEKKVFITNWYRPGDEFGSVHDDVTLKSEKWEIQGERREIPQQPKE